MKKLQYRFIGIATISITILLIVLLLPLNIFNFNRTYSRLRLVTDYIYENGGELPNVDNDADRDDLTIGIRVKNYFYDALGLQRSTSDPDDVLSEESTYQMRYFTVLYDEYESVISINDDHLSALTESEMKELAHYVRRNYQHTHLFTYNYTEYMYESYSLDDGTVLYVFLNCDSEMRSFHFFLYTSLMFGALCTVLFFVIVSALSKRLMAPYIRNLEIQKQFITNASHELKTPLAIISANTEVLELTEGENEWTGSIRHQIDRMNRLVTNLISLAKMQEKDTIELTDVNVSALATDSVDSYRTLIEHEKKSFTAEITPDLHVRAESKSLQELINILLDNANKYCDADGSVHLSLTSRGRNGARLVVTNTYAEGEHTDYSRFFDRFYREDSSHNSSVSGFGIGLSMAQQIAENFHGKITVEYKKPNISFVVTI